MMVLQFNILELYCFARQVQTNPNYHFFYGQSEASLGKHVTSCLN